MTRKGSATRLHEVPKSMAMWQGKDGQAYIDMASVPVGSVGTLCLPPRLGAAAGPVRQTVWPLWLLHLENVPRNDNDPEEEPSSGDDADDRDGQDLGAAGGDDEKCEACTALMMLWNAAEETGPVEGDHHADANSPPSPSHPEDDDGLGPEALEEVRTALQTVEPRLRRLAGPRTPSKADLRHNLREIIGVLQAVLQ